jgi:hypothetical protein
LEWVWAAGTGLLPQSAEGQEYGKLKSMRDWKLEASWMEKWSDEISFAKNTVSEFIEYTCIKTNSDMNKLKFKNYFPAWNITVIWVN